MADDVVVQGRDVCKIYGQGETEVRALNSLNIDIKRGEMIAVMGPSGCGKTTFLNCFSGLDDISSGQVTLEGVDVHRLPDRQKTLGHRDDRRVTRSPEPALLRSALGRRKPHDGRIRTRQG